VRSNTIKDVPIYMSVYSCSILSLHGCYALVVPSGMKQIQRKGEKKRRRDCDDDLFIDD